MRDFIILEMTNGTYLRVRVSEIAAYTRSGDDSRTFMWMRGAMSDDDPFGVTELPQDIDRLIDLALAALAGGY